jgi:hypothetical protein
VPTRRNKVDTNVSTTREPEQSIKIDSSSTSPSQGSRLTNIDCRSGARKLSRESLTIEGRDIEGVLPQSTPTELTVRAIVLQRQLYGLNVPAIAATYARILPLDSGATTAVSKRQCPLPEEADTAVDAVAMEGEAQHLLLLPHQSLQEPVQS